MITVDVPFVMITAACVSAVLLSFVVFCRFAMVSDILSPALMERWGLRFVRDLLSISPKSSPMQSYRSLKGNEQTKSYVDPSKPFHKNFWRIGNKWYNLNKWAHAHPGGAQVLLLARDKFDDCTYAFEAHHHDVPRVRKLLSNFEVSEEENSLCEESFTTSPMKRPDLIANETFPDLVSETGFYSTLRARVNAYLEKNGGAGPTTECLLLFYALLAVWFGIFAYTCATGSYTAAFFNGIVGAWLGGYGHSWIHQPAYRTYAYCLDLVALNSEEWLTSHLLSHHMYTNTPLDIHFEGTDPFLKVDPTVKRNLFQRTFSLLLHPVILFCGNVGNYLIHCGQLLVGTDYARGTMSIGKLFFPLEILIMSHFQGFYTGLALVLLNIGMTSVYYFTIALCNHNTEAAWDVDARNNSADWAQQMLNTCADVGTGSSFLWSIRYIWLNYHTVHHLFPHVDASKHPAIQQILLSTCAEYDVKYQHVSFSQMYMEMLETFRTPRQLGKEIMIYASSGS